MSGLVFACIAPHSSMIVPVLAGEEGQKALATRAAMEELGRRMAAAAPETVVVITPHGHRVDGVFSLLNNQRVRGELGLEKDTDADGPYGFDLASAEFDAATLEAVKAQDLGRLLTFDLASCLTCMVR